MPFGYKVSQQTAGCETQFAASSKIETNSGPACNRRNGIAE
jgi:hypothetical protein